MSNSRQITSPGYSSCHEAYINVSSPTDEVYDDEWFLALEEFLLIATEERYLRVRNALLLNLTPYGLVSMCRIAKRHIQITTFKLPSLEPLISQSLNTCVYKVLV